MAFELQALLATSTWENCGKILLEQLNGRPLETNPPDRPKQFKDLKRACKS